MRDINFALRREAACAKNAQNHYPERAAMALVKSIDVRDSGAKRLNGAAPQILRGDAAPAQPEAPRRPLANAAAPQRKRVRTFARQQKAAERIAAATSQLASGITEAASAAEEMRRPPTRSRPAPKRRAAAAAVA